MRVGQSTSDPEPGDVVVFWRESIESYKGHVGLFLGYSIDQSRIYCLGGNQGNQVSISAQPANRLLGFRRLQPSKIWKLPAVYLRLDDTGAQVVLLQDILKHLGYPVGTSDGIFGPKTEQCLRRLQAEGRLQADGVYGHDTKNYLNTVLNE
ncbi:peptidoglycan-binding protein [Marinoscillum sp.]|uniref:C40 family peptidase n=1 Tax=Marinoscillum sp. TaxID=2024838 RepID=UPI003BA941CC